MTPRSRNILMVLTAPLLSLGLLGGIVAEKQSYITPADAEAYHQRAKAAIESFPYVIAPYWTGTDVKDDPRVHAAVVKLLKPNVILRRQFVESVPNPPFSDREAHLLIVQCRDSRDMLGHYPPVCYVAHGMTMEKDPEPRDWTIGDRVIGGMEYRFVGTYRGETYRQVVYNFMVVPGKGIVRDMDGISSAAEDYQQRFYGAAQFQMVMDGNLSDAECDAIFTTLLGADLSIIKTVEQIQ